MDGVIIFIFGTSSLMVATISSSIKISRFACSSLGLVAVPHFFGFDFFDFDELLPVFGIWSPCWTNEDRCLRSMRSRSSNALQTQPVGAPTQLN